MRSWRPAATRAPTLRSVRPGTTSPTQKVENRLIARPCRGTQFRGCHAIASTERAVKIGQISEPDIERYSADLLVGIEGIPQQPVRADKALREHILSEGRAFAFEQPLDPPWLDPMTCGDGRYREVGLVEPGCDVLLDRAQPRRPRAPALGDVGRVPRRSDGERHEVVNVNHSLPSQPRDREGSCLLEDADVAGQKLQCGVFGRYWPTIRIVEIGNARRQTASWHQQMEVVVEPWNPQKPWFPASQHNRLPATHIEGSTELVRMAA